MTTQQIFQPCEPATLSPQSESFERVVRQARRAGGLAAAAITIAAIPVLVRLLAFADISALSLPGLALMVPVLILAGLFAARWASCSFVKEEETRLHDSALRAELSSSHAAE